MRNSSLLWMMVGAGLMYLYMNPDARAEVKRAVDNLRDSLEKDLGRTNHADNRRGSKSHSHAREGSKSEA